MDDDFNTPIALEAIFELIRSTNRLLDTEKLTKKDADKILTLLKKIDAVFKIMDFKKKKETLPVDITTLIRRREELRKQKKWKESDKIRADLLKKGYELMDTPEGTKVRKK